MDAIDALAALPGTAQTLPDEDTVIIAEIVDTADNLPAVRPSAELVIPRRSSDLEQVVALATAWNGNPGFNRWKWANDLPDAIRRKDTATFRLLILSALANGFDGVPVDADEFEVALLRLRAQLAGQAVA